MEQNWRAASGMLLKRTAVHQVEFWDFNGLLFLQQLLDAIRDC